MDAITELIYTTPHLTSLHIERVNVSEAALNQLLLGFIKDDGSVARLKQLGLIDLNCELHLPEKKNSKKNTKKCGEAELHAISKYLMHKSCKLQTLYLNGNAIALQGAMNLAQGLCINKTVKILDLSRNQLGTKGTQLICDALNTSMSLKSLDLSYNDIGNTGARSLAQLIPRINVLELRIQGNGISSDGMIALF